LESGPLISIIVPAYNERDNIEALVKTIREALEPSGYSYEVVLVDDGSSDGTAEEAFRAAEKYSVRLRVVRHERNMGKPSALLTGFSSASGRYLVALDADLEFHPRYVPSMLEALRSSGADVVGGYRVDRRGLLRRLISWGAKVLARVLIPEASGLRDPTTEIYIVDRKVVEGCRLRARIKPYLEIIARCRPSRVVEIPYPIDLRKCGESKFRLKWIFEYIVQILDLTGYYPLRYLVGALVALPVSIYLWQYVGVLSPLLASMIKWAFIWRDVGPVTTIGAKAAAIALKALEVAWPVTAALEFAVLTLIRRRLYL